MVDRDNNNTTRNRTQGNSASGRPTQNRRSQQSSSGSADPNRRSQQSSSGSADSNRRSDASSAQSGNAQNRNAQRNNAQKATAQRSTAQKGNAQKGNAGTKKDSQSLIQNDLNRIMYGEEKARELDPRRKYQSELAADIEGIASRQTNRDEIPEAYKPPRSAVSRGGDPRGGDLRGGDSRGGVSRGGDSRGGDIRGGDPRDKVSPEGVSNDSQNYSADKYGSRKEKGPKRSLGFGHAARRGKPAAPGLPSGAASGERRGAASGAGVAPGKSLAPGMASAPGTVSQKNLFEGNKGLKKGKNAADESTDKAGLGKHKKKKSLMWRIIFWASLVIFIGSAAVLGVYLFSYQSQQNEYNELVEDVAGKSFDYITETPLDQVTIDWNKLKSQNPETVGWIYIPGTIINYPIVHTSNNEKYLTTGFKGSEGTVKYGAIFLQAANSTDMSDRNNVIFGHNMGNGSMFHRIREMVNQSTFNSYQTVYILTPEKNFKLQSCVFTRIAETDVSIMRTGFSSQEAFQSYVADLFANCMYKSNYCPQPSQVSKLFQLVTCVGPSEGEGRYVLTCSVVAEVLAPTASANQAATTDAAADQGQTDANGNASSGTDTSGNTSSGASGNTSSGTSGSTSGGTSGGTTNNTAGTESTN